MLKKIPEEFSCKNKQFLLKNTLSNEILAKVCICGSIFCYHAPQILNKFQHKNERELFVEFWSDLDKETPKFQNYDKSDLNVPAPGYLETNGVKGYCQVCSLYYNDYLVHIKKKQHIQKIRTNKWHQKLINVGK